MKSSPTRIPEEITRSMQHMSERNGGLLVDFKPIRRYAEVVPGDEHYHERVRTVLDWIAVGTEVGLLTRKNWRRAFARMEDLRRFCEELRRYDASMEDLHLRAFERLGFVRGGAPLGYADLAREIGAVPPQLEAA